MLTAHTCPYTTTRPAKHTHILSNFNAPQNLLGTPNAGSKAPLQSPCIIQRGPQNLHWHKPLQVGLMQVARGPHVKKHCHRDSFGFLDSASRVPSILPSARDSTPVPQRAPTQT